MICVGNDKSLTFLLKRLAFIVQNPCHKNISAVLMLGSIFGCYSNPNSSIDVVVGHFNDSIRDKRLIIVNEVSGKDFKKSNRFKTYITEGQVDSEQKFRQKKHTENIANFILSNNEKVLIYVPHDDRRFFVVESKSPQTKRRSQ